MATEEYVTKIALPTMQAVDSLPTEYRSLLQDLGYIETYLAWRKGVTPQVARSWLVQAEKIPGSRGAPPWM